MTKYVMIYYGQEDPQADTMDVWMKWFNSFADKIVDWGNPFINGVEVTSEKTKKLTADEYPATGYSVIEVDNFEEAETIAKGSPSPQGVRLYEATNVE